MKYFNPDDISIKSDITAEELDFAVDTIKEDNGLEDLGSAFIEAQEKYNVNAVILCAIVCYESGFGLSKLSIEKNNLMGLDARDNLKGTNKYGREFDTKEECILYGAHRIGKQYLERNEAASYRYLDGKKDIWSVGKLYSTKKSWADDVIDLSKRLCSAVNVKDEIIEKNEENIYKKKYFDLLDYVSEIKNIIDRIDMEVE